MSTLIHDDLGRDWRDWVVDMVVWIVMVGLAIDGWVAYASR